MHNYFYTIHCFLKIKCFQFFPTVKVVANYAEVGRVGTLEAGFNKFRLLKFSEIFTIVWILIIQSQLNKIKIFSDIKYPKHHFTIEIAQVRPAFDRKFNFRVFIWKRNTEIYWKEKETQGKFYS